MGGVGGGWGGFGLTESLLKADMELSCFANCNWISEAGLRVQGFARSQGECSVLPKRKIKNMTMVKDGNPYNLTYMGLMYWFQKGDSVAILRLAVLALKNKKNNRGLF